MKAKKFATALIASAFAVFSVFPAYAGGDEIELTETSPESDQTEVLAVVSNVEPGSPQYIISVPSKIDFGTLRKPQTSAPNTIEIPFQIKAELIDNLSSGSVVAVLMKDAVLAGTGSAFTVKGQDTVNSDKALDYSVTITADDGNDVDVSSRMQFANGYPVYGFTSTGQVKNGMAILDQAQLYNKSLSEYAGSYKGNIHFYSTIAAPTDFMLSN